MSNQSPSEDPLVQTQTWCDHPGNSNFDSKMRGNENSRLDCLSLKIKFQPHVPGAAHILKRCCRGIHNQRTTQWWQSLQHGRITHLKMDKGRVSGWLRLMVIKKVEQHVELQWDSDAVSIHLWVLQNAKGTSGETLGLIIVLPLVATGVRIMKEEENKSVHRLMASPYISLRGPPSHIFVTANTKYCVFCWSLLSWVLREAFMRSFINGVFL